MEKEVVVHVQYLIINYNGKEYEKYYTYITYVCITESLFCIPETNRTLQINYTSIFKNSF